MRGQARAGGGAQGHLPPAAVPQLEMARESLVGLPEMVLPAGYLLRGYRPGDEQAWCGLVNEGIPGDWTPERLRAEVARAHRFQPQDLLFGERAGELVGTAWALRWWEQPEEVGYLHMVAVARRRQGRGLGRALTVAVLHRFREMGLERAILRTDDFRLPAIALYLSLGFRPVLSHESHRARWQAVLRTLGEDEEVLR